MSAPSSSPRGERAGKSGARWETVLRSTGEVVVEDGPWGGPATVRPWTADGPLIPEPRPNRAARRAISRAARRRTL